MPRLVFASHPSGSDLAMRDGRMPFVNVSTSTPFSRNGSELNLSLYGQVYGIEVTQGTVNLLARNPVTKLILMS